MIKRNEILLRFLIIICSLNLSLFILFCIRGRIQISSQGIGSLRSLLSEYSFNNKELLNNWINYKKSI
jgi:hypothetical protein